MQYNKSRTLLPEVALEQLSGIIKTAKSEGKYLFVANLKTWVDPYKIEDMIKEGRFCFPLGWWVIRRPEDYYKEVSEAQRKAKQKADYYTKKLEEIQEFINRKDQN